MTATCELPASREGVEFTVKKVQWAKDLESVYYFVTPRNLREDFKKKIKKFKKIAGGITDRPVKIITQFGEASLSLIDFIANYGQSGTFETELLNYEELAKECDRLFGMCEAQASLQSAAERDI